MTAHPAHVLVVGATGGIGRMIAAGQRLNLGGTALVRDLGRGERVVPGIELQALRGCPLSTPPAGPLQRRRVRA